MKDSFLSYRIFTITVIYRGTSILILIAEKSNTTIKENPIWNGYNLSAILPKIKQ